MKNMFSLLLILGICLGSSLAQTKDAYESGSESGNIIDPSKLDISHSMSFGMSSSSSSDLKSQSLYSTMMQYQFSKPVTLNLSFGLPIHSTYNSAHNLNQDNITSADYFRGMPFNASLTWQPSDNFLMQISVGKNNRAYNSFFSPAGYYQPHSLYDRRVLRESRTNAQNTSEGSENSEADKNSN